MKNKLRYHSNSFRDGNLLPTIYETIFAIANVEFDGSKIPLKRLVFVSSKLNNTGMVDQLLGNDGLKKIKSGLKVPSLNIPILFNSIDKHLPIRDEVIVTLGLTSDRQLYFDEECHNFVFIGVSYLENELEKWCRISQSTNLFSQAKLPPYDHPGKILCQALISMDSINRSGSTLHESDKNRVCTYFKALLDYSIDTDENIIESYCINTMNWRKETVDLVLSYLSKMKAGKRVQYKPLNKSSYFFKQWE